MLLHHYCVRSMLALSSPDIVGCDDLYVCLRILLFDDLHIAATTLTGAPCEVHPSRTKVNYTLRRGYQLSDHPIQFVALVAQLARAPEILEAFYRLLSDWDPDEPSAALMVTYTPERLRAILAQ